MIRVGTSTRYREQPVRFPKQWRCNLTRTINFRKSMKLHNAIAVFKERYRQEYGREIDDAEMERIVDELRAMAEILFSQWAKSHVRDKDALRSNEMTLR